MKEVNVKSLILAVFRKIHGSLQRICGYGETSMSGWSVFYGKFNRNQSMKGGES